jgi:outer membrane protein insertion porin family
LFKLGPKSGVIFNFGQSFSGLGGDKTSLKSSAKIVAQRDILNEELKLTGVLEGGILSYTRGESRVMDRFFLGSSKMRGFKPDGIGPRECPNKQCNSTDNDALGGERFAVMRLEAEFPLGLPDEYGLSGGLFYDIGNVWSLSQLNNNVLYEDGAWRQAIGAAIFWETPIGPLRFNFTDTLRKELYDKDESFDLTISTRF